MRRILSPNGMVQRVSDVVASGLVGAGHAVYADVDEVVEEPETDQLDDVIEADEDSEDELEEVEPDEPEAETEELISLSDFDPSDHRVAEVLEHLAMASPAERARVLALESEGKARNTIP